MPTNSSGLYPSSRLLTGDASVPLLGVVSRLAEQKGIDRLLGAVPEVLRRMPSQLVVLGSGEGRYRGEAGTGLRRDSLPLAFLIGDVSDRRAGTYSDVISISVTPQ